MSQLYQILLIEDDSAIGQSLQEGLHQAGFKVIWKMTGAEGLQYIETHTIHLVLLDVRLPDGSGFDICHQMRKSGLHQPILMLTVQREETDKVLGLELGADDYITKPFSFRELLSRIRAQLRRAYGELTAAGSSQTYIADLFLDHNTGQARRDNEVINLTPTEYRLLAYLAQHRNQTLTRTQIITGVWGYAPEIENERTIKVYIRRLREKIEVDPSKPEILLTVPGIGYRLMG